MKQFYIPTSSLNFNNIFSSESISPAAFYEHRRFGYSRWTSIPENNLSNAILLYDSPHMFSRPESEVEDHPMLIEIRTDEEFVPVEEGVFYSNHTIYLNPWNTRVWFFSDADFVTAMSLSDSSLETKLLRLYKRYIHVGSFDGVYHPIESNDIELNLTAIDSDKRINRLKGLLYGYYIGAFKSVSPQIAESIHALNDIHDTFAAISLSPDKKATHPQVDTLGQAFEVLFKNNPFFTDLVRESQSMDVAQSILKLLDAYSVRTPLYDYDVAHHLEILHSSQGENNYSLLWVKNQIASIENRADNAQNLLNPDNAEIIVGDCKLSTIKNIQNETIRNLFLTWVNGLLLGDKYNGKVSAQRYELATDLAQSAKEFLASDWDSSPIRAFLNQLRHLVNGEDAQLDWSYDVLASVAAVVYKGDDWAKLLRFMQTQNMFDYRIAFAVFGELNGFANLTRDFTDMLLNQENNYVAEVYKEFYGQLMGCDICKDSMPQPNFCQVHTEKVETMAASPEESKQNSILTETILNFFNSEEFNYIKKEKLLPELLAALKENGDNEDIQKFLSILFKHKGWDKKNKPGKLMAEKFEVRKEKSPSQAGRDLFSDVEAKSEENSKSLLVETTQEDNNKRPAFVCDPSAYGLIESCLPKDRKVRDQVRIDLIWFQENYKEFYMDRNGKQQQGKYSDRSKDNMSSISHFRLYCTNKLKRTEKTAWVAEIWAKVDIPSIITKLNDIYL